MSLMPARQIAPQPSVIADDACLSMGKPRVLGPVCSTISSSKQKKKGKAGSAVSNRPLSAAECKTLARLVWDRAPAHASLQHAAIKIPHWDAILFSNNAYSGKCRLERS